ncbi:right-handed parallel beta-helix repeat-containing protein [Xylanimonas ulmi]|uniref:Parallel beta helix pectate lyase-like protein n=1 Tax=Xylanimonas ulmi TaxID=228973 RepID=A0A4V2EY89_9MICO|nr:right-handed parallel beta-helix repeat-containing protein [Xylanibacterium ulmi]RZS62150.1 parallel beta helix pectate lyase-like protein [Xylanibacterium ulmi]
MTIWHVAVTGHDAHRGDEGAPLRTINAAAARAMPGDTVRVREGVYREGVRPPRGGLSDTRRITFEAAAGESVRITGAEAVTGWTRAEGGVWRTQAPHALFGAFNPFAQELWGDWLIEREGQRATRGAVYLDGRALRQVYSLAAVVSPERRETVVDAWTDTPQVVEDPRWSQAVWYAEVGDDVTVIWANFLDVDPREALTEVNVRPAVFYPERSHIDYITVRGFELAQAATPWAPPTADQPGLVGPHWAKGWVIEDNTIHDSKCAAVSLGKEISTGHNFASVRGDKPGYQYQLESVFEALEQGWSRDRVGSHVVRRNHIYDCGQNGVVGHLGAVFSTIEDNHIHHIGDAREFDGFEIAGIKLHAAIDVRVVGNRVDHCTLGTWLDWQAQGTRVARNVYHSNTRDLFVEVSHGPYLVDHNVFASRVAVENFSQGGAYVNNLVSGVVRCGQVLDRVTPYHRPHSTAVRGFANILGGDDRWIGNLFTGADVAGALGPRAIWRDAAPAASGASAYDGCPAGWDAYLEAVNAEEGDHERFGAKRQGVYIHDNTYANGARPFAGEVGARVVSEPVTVTVLEREDGLWLETDIPDAVAAGVVGLVTAADLPRVRFPDADFEDPDGSAAAADRDLVGAPKAAGARYPAGPLAHLPAGRTRIPIHR